MRVNPEHSFLREDEARTERWAHLTEGISDEYQLAVVETLMDNARAATDGSLSGVKLEATSTQSIATFNRIAYPMIRRIYPGLVANGLVSIQPTTLPVTLVFFLDFMYNSDLSPTQRGQRTDYEAGQFNRYFASGVIRDEGLGNGNGTAVLFTTALHPVREGSETVYVNSTPVTNYAINYATGEITFAAAPTTGAVVTVDYALVMEGLGSQGNSEIPEIKLGLSSAQVGTESKKLAAEWTIEAQQDLRAYHGLSAEKLLVKHMSDEITREIDRIIISDLTAHAGAGNVNWDKTVPSGVKKVEHIETLLHAMTDVSNEIYKKRFRHANWAIMGPDTLNMLNKLNTFRALGWGQDGAVPSAEVVSGPAVVGTLSSVMRVIVDPLFDADKVLLGYKGNDWTEASYVFAPYTAFHTDVFVNPRTQKPYTSLMARYGRHVVDDNFLGTVTIQN
jgi:hypothetical protein